MVLIQNNEGTDEQTRSIQTNKGSNKQTNKVQGPTKERINKCRLLVKETYRDL